MKNQNFENRYKEAFGTQPQTIRRTLPLGGKLIRLWVILSGSVTIAGGTTNGAARFPEHPLVGLLKRIRVRCVKADGSRYPDGVIRDYSPRTILRRAQFYRKKFVGDLNGGTCNGAAGTYQVYMSFPIYFAQPDLKRPIETALNVDETAYKAVYVEVDTGDKTTAFNGNDRNWDFSQLSVQFADDREAVDGDTYVLVEKEHEYLIAAAELRYEDKAMPVEGALLDLLFLTQNGSSGAAAGVSALADTILNRVQIEAQNADIDLYRNDIHQAMVDNGDVDAAQNIAGQYLINFVRSGMLSKVVPLSGFKMTIDQSNPSGSNADSVLVSPRILWAPVPPSGMTLAQSLVQPGQKSKNVA